MMERLLELRKRIAAKRPEFTISNKHKRKRVARCSWRAPRGLHNKERLGKHGKMAVVQAGYRNPRAVRGLSRDGLLPVRVSRVQDLSGIDANSQVVLLSRVGMRNRLEILKECKAKGIKVLNFKVEETLSSIDKRMQDRKKRSSDIKKRSVKAEVKPKKDEVVEDEDKKDQERKEMEKLLTRREK